jgi:hypothetical protein
MAAAKPNPRKKSLMHNLGEFFGHIAQGVTSDPHAPPGPTRRPVNTAASRSSGVPPAPPDGRIVRQETQQHEVLTPDGKLVLRRTIIDEVERPPEQR